MTRSMMWQMTINAFVAVLAVIGLVICIDCLAGCSSANVERAKNAVDLAGYQTELDACRAAGKDAGSYAIYERCAQDSDSRHGVKP